MCNKINIDWFICNKINRGWYICNKINRGWFICNKMHKFLPNITHVCSNHVSMVGLLTMTTK